MLITLENVELGMRVFNHGTGRKGIIVGLDTFNSNQIVTLRHKAEILLPNLAYRMVLTGVILVRVQFGEKDGKTEIRQASIGPGESQLTLIQPSLLSATQVNTIDSLLSKLKDIC